LLNATFAHVAENDIPRLRSWLASLSGRRDELRKSYQRQGTRHELFFLIRTQLGGLLVLISEIEDIERATSSFLLSNLPLDVEFKNLIQEISRLAPGVELLYDSSDHVPVSARPGASSTPSEPGPT
jgi:Tfp pilus assembly protein PilO